MLFRSWLLAAIVQHLKIQIRIRNNGYPRVEPWPLGLFIAAVLVLVGFYGLVAVILNPR